MALGKKTKRRFRELFFFGNTCTKDGITTDWRKEIKGSLELFFVLHWGH